MNSSVKFAVTLNILVLLSVLFTNSASGQNDNESIPNPSGGGSSIESIPNPPRDSKAFLTLDIHPHKLQAGQTFSLTGVLTDDKTGDPLSDKKITFNTNSGIDIPEKSTDSDGKYEVADLQAPEDSGEYTIAAHFDGDFKYKATDSGPQTFTIKLDKTGSRPPSPEGPSSIPRTTFPDGISLHKLTSESESFIHDYDTIVFLVIAAIVVAIIGIGLHKIKSHRSKKHAGDSVEVLMRGGIGK